MRFASDREASVSLRDIVPSKGQVDPEQNSDVDSGMIQSIDKELTVGPVVIGQDCDSVVILLVRLRTWFCRTQLLY